MAQAVAHSHSSRVMSGLKAVCWYTAAQMCMLLLRHYFLEIQRLKCSCTAPHFDSLFNTATFDLACNLAGR